MNPINLSRKPISMLIVTTASLENSSGNPNYQFFNSSPEFEFCIKKILRTSDGYVEGSRASSMCVFFPSILDIKFVGRTSRGQDSKKAQQQQSSCRAIKQLLNLQRDQKHAVNRGERGIMYVDPTR